MRQRESVGLWYGWFGWVPRNKALLKCSKTGLLCRAELECNSKTAHPDSSPNRLHDKSQSPTRDIQRLTGRHGVV